HCIPCSRIWNDGDLKYLWAIQIPFDHREIIDCLIGQKIFIGRGLMVRIIRDVHRERCNDLSPNLIGGSPYVIRYRMTEFLYFIQVQNPTFCKVDFPRFPDVLEGLVRWKTFKAVREPL